MAALRLNAAVLVLSGGLIVFHLIRRFLRDANGATAIEYGLIAALVAVIAIGAITNVGTKLSTTFGTVSSKLL